MAVVISVAKVVAMRVRNQNAVLSNGCMPGHLLCANPAIIADAQYDDFEEQAAQLVGFDQSYLQLSPGPFRGRFMSCFLGDGLSLHLEHCTQTLEQSLASDGQAYNIGVVITPGAPFRLNGHDLGPDQVMIATPGSALHMRSPAHGAILAIVIHRTRMEAATATFPNVMDWLGAMSGGVQILQAPELARRIREDVVQSLQAAHCFRDGSETARSIGDALMAGMLSKLALDLARKPDEHAAALPLSFARFLACRDILHRDWTSIRHVGDLLAATGEVGRRTVEISFSDQVAMGPLTYQRILRLNMARRALRDRALFGQSIGDIAAQFDFWSGSQFATQYRALFGQLPSETRLQAGYQQNPQS